MNILEVKKVYDEGKKIRHSSWPIGRWCSNHPEKNQVITGITSSSGQLFGDWLSKYAEGWELLHEGIYVRDMKPGQKFIGPTCQIMMRVKNREELNLDINCINLTSFELCSLNDSIYRYELVN